MSDATTQPAKPRRGRLSGTEVLVLVGIAALLLCIVLALMDRRREMRLAHAAQRGCPRALMQLTMALTMYLNANGDVIPQDLDALQRAVQTEMGADTWRLFTCPYASARGHPPCASGALHASWYVYCVPPGVTNYAQIAAPSRVVCAYEPLGNHDGTGMMVLYWDGHITWEDARQAKRIVDELRAGHNPPRAEVVK